MEKTVFDLFKESKYKPIWGYNSDLGFQDVLSTINFYFKDNPGMLLDFLLSIHESALRDWAGFSDVMISLSLWKDSKNFKKILDFIAKLPASAATDWRGFSWVIGRINYDESVRWGLILWEDSKMLDTLLGFIFKVRKFAKKDWHAFSRIIGVEENGVLLCGLITLKDSDKFMEIIGRIESLQEHFSYNWRELADSFTG